MSTASIGPLLPEMRVYCRDSAIDIILYNFSTLLVMKRFVNFYFFKNSIDDYLKITTEGAHSY